MFVPIRSLTGCLPIKSRSGERIKESDGECFFHPSMIASAKGCVLSNGLYPRSRRTAMYVFLLGVRSNSKFDTQVLMKFSFKNSMTWLLERATALSVLPLAQHDSSINGPSIEIAWIGFCCVCAISNTCSGSTQLICCDL